MALAWASFPYFITLLKDDKGNHLTVPWHIEQWAKAMQQEPRLALLAARDHGKTWTAWAYILWRCWRHNRGPDGVLLEGNPEGNFEFTYFTSIKPLAIERFGRIQQFMLDNTHLFGDILPRREPGQTMAVLRDQWAKTSFRLRNGVTGTPRSIGSATRGLHPDLIVADDIVDPKNSLTALQRGRVWAYLVGTIVPMAGPKGQVIVMGTPQHYEDALFRLSNKPGWRWLKFRAADLDTHDVLWPEERDWDYLQAQQSLDPLVFSREYQMDPRDDASSIFPRELTARARVQGAQFGFQRPYPVVLLSTGDYILLGGDIAISEAVGADYTVLMVALYNRFTQKRRLLWASRRKGLTFDEQVQQLRDVCRDMNVAVGVVEQNGFQRWLHQALAKYPETNTRIFGHNTGVERQQLTDGIPGIKLSLENDLWIVPSSADDPEAVAFADVWQDELNAFGWADGKLQGVGAHDDTVLATWFLERAVRMVEAFQPAEGGDIITGEEVGIPRVQIGAGY